MKVLIVGLGLMGGAYALRLKKKGHTVYGVDINENSVKFALENNYIDDGSTDAKEYISKSDLIILCIYPQAIINFIKSIFSGLPSTPKSHSSLKIKTSSLSLSLLYILFISS